MIRGLQLRLKGCKRTTSKAVTVLRLACSV